MKTISTQARAISLVFAIVTSGTVLGATVAGMQAGNAAPHAVVVMERATVTAGAL